MNYALNLSEDGRVLSVTFPKYAPVDAATVEELPEGNLSDYRFDGSGFVYDPVLVEAVTTATWQDRMEAQIAYTAMMTDTLLEV